MTATLLSFDAGAGLHVRLLPQLSSGHRVHRREHDFVDRYDEGSNNPNGRTDAAALCQFVPDDGHLAMHGNRHQLHFLHGERHWRIAFGRSGNGGAMWTDEPANGLLHVLLRLAVHLWKCRSEWIGGFAAELGLRLRLAFHSQLNARVRQITEKTFSVAAALCVLRVTGLLLQIELSLFNNLVAKSRRHPFD